MVDLEMDLWGCRLPHLPAGYSIPRAQPPRRPGGGGSAPPAAARPRIFAFWEFVAIYQTFFARARGARRAPPFVSNSRYTNIGPRRTAPRTSTCSRRLTSHSTAARRTTVSGSGMQSGDGDDPVPEPCEGDATQRQSHPRPGSYAHRPRPSAHGSPSCDDPPPAVHEKKGGGDGGGGEVAGRAAKEPAVLAHTRGVYLQEHGAWTICMGGFTAACPIRTPSPVLRAHLCRCKHLRRAAGLSSSCVAASAAFAAGRGERTRSSPMGTAKKISANHMGAPGKERWRPRIR